MMQRYSGDFLDAIDGLRALLGCRGRVWPVSVQQASVCAEYDGGSMTRGEVEVDALQSSGRAVTKIWLEPPVSIHPAVTRAIAGFDAVTIGPGSFYTSLMPIFLVRGVADALKNMKGPVILVANLLIENLVEPAVTGRTLSIHPLVVLLVTTLGGIVGGLVGLVMAVPLTVIAAKALPRLARIVDVGADHLREQIADEGDPDAGDEAAAADADAAAAEAGTG